MARDDWIDRFSPEMHEGSATEPVHGGEDAELKQLSDSVLAEIAARLGTTFGLKE